MDLGEVTNAANKTRKQKHQPVRMLVNEQKAFKNLFEDTLGITTLQRDRTKRESNENKKK